MAHPVFVVTRSHKSVKTSISAQSPSNKMNIFIILIQICTIILASEIMIRIHYTGWAIKHLEFELLQSRQRTSGNKLFYPTENM